MFSKTEKVVLYTLLAAWALLDVAAWFFGPSRKLEPRRPVIVGRRERRPLSFDDD